MRNQLSTQVQQQYEGPHLFISQCPDNMLRCLYAAQERGCVQEHLAAASAIRAVVYFSVAAAAAATVGVCARNALPLLLLVVMVTGIVQQLVHQLARCK